MPDIRKGGCLCGAAQYEIDLANAYTLACHCTECQKHLGAPYSLFTVVPAPQFRWLSKPSKSIKISDKATRLFCGECGTYLKWEGNNADGEAEINTMTLDDPSGIVIQDEIFTRSRMLWVTPIEGACQHETSRDYTST